jgi:hypothetical protein
MSGTNSNDNVLPQGGFVPAHSAAMYAQPPPSQAMSAAAAVPPLAPPRSPGAGLSLSENLR